jgi:hypothetical protein
VTCDEFGGMAANDRPVPVRTLAHAVRLIREARQLNHGRSGRGHARRSDDRNGGGIFDEDMLSARLMVALVSMIVSTIVTRVAARSLDLAAAP